MTLKQLIELFREEADDVAEPHLWSDALATSYANEAQVEACRRARLLTDSTGELSLLDVPAGVLTIDLDPRIIFVRRVQLASDSMPLPKISRRDLDRCRPNWETEAGADPVAYCLDYQTNAVALIPPSSVADTARLTVIREPLDDMVEDDDEPGIAPRYHRSLVQWMLYRAFSKQDSESNDPKKALTALAMFEQEFGKRSSAVDETWINERHGYDDAEGLY